MIGPIPEETELQGLLDALCEGSIAPDQMRRLEEILLANPHAEAYYVQYMSQFADLRRHFNKLPTTPALCGLMPMAPSSAASVQVRTPTRLARVRGFLSKRSKLVLTGAAAVLLAFGLWRLEVSKYRPDEPDEPSDYSVAVLLQAPGARWHPSDSPPHAGAPLMPGWLHLESGLAQIEFYNGATVILEGPAEFQLVSRSEAYCSSGKLRALVPPQARGFTIRSPKLDLVDRGTEFGLQVGDPESRTEVHVFEGKVELYDPGARTELSPHRDLTTGEGIRLDVPGTLEPIRPDPSAFQTTQQLEARASSAARQSQKEWLAASAKLRLDPSLIVYFTFQAEHSWDRALLNQAQGRQGPSEATIVGCSWAAGRWPGKQGLEFKRVSDRIRFHVPGEFDALTMAIWVRIDALPNRYSSLMMTDGWDERAPHWHIRQDGKISLGVQGNEQSQGVNYFTSSVFTLERLGQWVHLALVYDRDTQLVTVYVDGRSVKRAPIKLDVALSLGDVELGNWNIASFSDKYPIRHLSGCMDEFLMFNRALTRPEIEQIYDAGRPSL
ncbi:MAG TPA: LamG-like jellyroll fold domain-containing protein [Gemmataceae bacterium]|jgi:hypothetical protein|nr:LamG-like jellyroll fold domain-containing protein [Gemmataceae bacterium]